MDCRWRDRAGKTWLLVGSLGERGAWYVAGGIPGREAELVEAGVGGSLDVVVD